MNNISHAISEKRKGSSDQRVESSKQRPQRNEIKREMTWVETQAIGECYSRGKRGERTRKEGERVQFFVFYQNYIISQFKKFEPDNSDK